MMQAQNSMFMGQNSYAQQIGVSPPTFGAGSGGMGSYGGGGRGAFSFAPAASFGGAGGYGGGNKFASMGVSAMGGVATIGAGLALDPLGSFLGGAAGGLARGGLGAALGGGMAAAAPMIPLAIAAQATIGGMVRGGQQQAAVAQNLNSFQFQNAQSRTGQGFTRDDAKAIGDQIRAISHVPEMMTSMEELTRLMPKLKQSGVMQGVRTAAEFSHRFKEAITTIRDMSKVLGSTMEEAEQFFAQSRSMGFTGRKDQLKNVLNAQFTSAQTGMDMGQVMQMQQTGANMSRQVGGRGAQGATAIARIAQRLEAGRQAGGISEEMFQDVSGQEGDAGVRGSAERMYGLMLNMRNTSAGRLVMAGAMKRGEDGKVSLDEDVIQKFNTGRMSIDDLKRRASSLSNDDKISFAYRAQGSLGSQLAGSLDAGRMMQGLVGGKGKDAAALVLGRYTGGNEQEMDMMMAMGGVGGSTNDIAQMGKQKAREAAFRERTDPSAILKRLGTRLHSSTIGNVEAAGAKIYSELGKAYDSVMDEFLGRAVVTVSKEGADSLAKAMSGGSKEEMKKILQAASGLKERGATANTFGMRDAIALGGGLGAPGSLDAVRKLAGGLRNTDMAAFLMRGDSDTGRSMEAQAEFTRSITGGSGLTDDARSRQGRYLDSGLGISGSAEAKGAQSAVRKARAEIENFRGMDDERKLVELRSSLQKSMMQGVASSPLRAKVSPMMLTEILTKEGPEAADKYLKANGVAGGLQEAMQTMSSSNDPEAKDAANLMRAGVAAVRAGASDMLTGIIAASQGNEEDSKIKISKALRLSKDVSLKEGIAQAQREMETAKSELTKGTWRGGGGLSDSEAAVITSNPEARKALGAALDPDHEQNAAVRAALGISDPEKAAEALNKLGFKVKASDIEDMKKVRDKGDTGSNGSIMNAIKAYEKGERGAQAMAIASAVSSKAEEIGAAIEATQGLDPESKKAAQALQASLSSFGQNMTEEDLNAVRKNIGDLTDKIGKGGKEAGALASATGDIGSMIAETVDQGRGLKGKKGRLTQEEVAKAYGLDLKDKNVKEMLEPLVAGGMGSAGVNVDELNKKVAQYKSSKAIAAKDQKESGAPETGEQKLLDTLGKIDKTLGNNTAVMTLLANSSGAKIDEKLVTGAQQYLKENNPVPGSK